MRGEAQNRRTLTAKNRSLIERAEEPAFLDRLITLPQHIKRMADAAANPRHGAACARDAVAIELLLTCGMRLGNLSTLRLGETISKVGAEGQWVIDIPGVQVKNGQPLRFRLLPESVELLEWYLLKWHGQCAGPSCPWLFPRSNGAHVNGAHLSNMIAVRTRKQLGVRITCHQFRHLTAELYLQHDPNGLGIVSQHLGHRDFSTTRQYYAREQTRLATPLYQEVIRAKRAAVGPRQKLRIRRAASRRDEKGGL